MPRNLMDTIKAAKNVGQPIIGISSPDQQALIARICEAINGDTPKVAWDVVRGLRGLNPQGVSALAKVGNADALAATANPVEALVQALKLSPGTMLFFQNAHRHLHGQDGAAVAQAMSNLRDPFKATQRMLIPTAPTLELPAELASDVILLDEELPDDDTLGAIHDEIVVEAQKFYPQFPTPEVHARDQAVSAARGTAPFIAEGIFAMSLRDEGLDLSDAWARKRTALKQVKGINFTYDESITFDLVGGQGRLKEWATSLAAGPERPRLIVRVDEIEKSVSGAAHDTSGVSQDQHRALLNEMEERQHTGFIAVGPPGTGKSLASKVLASLFGCPTIDLDLGATKGGIVGQSEQQIRAVLKVIDAVGANRVLWVGTCNRLEQISPELRRRFTDGIWMFGLPSRTERAAIWSIHLKAFGLKLTPEQAMREVNDEHWTGAEIRNVCRNAYRHSCSLSEAAAYIVPVMEADPRSIESLYELAHGRFLSASYKGKFDKERGEDAGAVKRMISLGQQQQPEGGPDVVIAVGVSDAPMPSTAAATVPGRKTKKES